MSNRQTDDWTKHWAFLAGKRKQGRGRLDVPFFAARQDEGASMLGVALFESKEPPKKMVKYSDLHKAARARDGKASN